MKATIATRNAVASLALLSILRCAFIMHVLCLGFAEQLLIYHCCDGAAPAAVAGNCVISFMTAASIFSGLGLSGSIVSVACPCHTACLVLVSNASTDS